MLIQDRQQLIELLQKHRLWTKKSLGQHFLFDPTVCQKMTETANLSSNDEVLEIGAGIGILTTHLADTAAHVTTLELDRKTFQVLKETTAGYKNITHLNEDCLSFTPERTPYKIIANLPYQITGRIFRHFLEEVERPTSITVLIQKEVAHKIIQTPPRNNLLSLSIRTFGDAQIIATIPPNVFLPPPKVHSSIIHIDLLKEPRIKDIKNFFKLINICFKQSRKTLRNALLSGPWSKEQAIKALQDSSLNPNLRSSNLALKDWETLTTLLYHA